MDFKELMSVNIPSLEQNPWVRGLILTLSLTGSSILRRQIPECVCEGLSGLG